MVAVEIPAAMEMTSCRSVMTLRKSSSTPVTTWGLTANRTVSACVAASTLLPEVSML